MDRRSFLTALATSPILLAALQACGTTSTSTDFGSDLYAALAARETSSPNLVCSPASVALALAMLLAGAEGDTATQLATALHTGDASALAASMNALTSEFDRRTETIEIPGGDPAEVVLAIANSLRVQTGFPIEDAYLEVLATQYGAGLRSVDYQADAEGARQAINAWVGEATKDRIPELLGEGAVTVATELTLVNAV